MFLILTNENTGDHAHNTEEDDANSVSTSNVWNEKTQDQSEA
jgi:hypothetical protein